MFTLWRNRALQNNTHYTSNSGCVIAVKDSRRDLRLTMSNNASFRRQIKNVVDSANKMCGWILRTFTTREPILMLTLCSKKALGKVNNKTSFPQSFIIENNHITDKSVTAESFNDYFSNIENLLVRMFQNQPNNFMTTS